MLYVYTKHLNSSIHSMEMEQLQYGTEAKDEKCIALFLIPWNDPLPAGFIAVFDAVALSF